MFTGLVEGLGTIADIIPEGLGMRLAVVPPPQLLAGTSIGDSVAVNGCCLTAVADQERRWNFQAGPETLSRTNLGALRPGDRVNLERSLPANARLGFEHHDLPPREREPAGDGEPHDARTDDHAVEGLHWCDCGGRHERGHAEGAVSFSAAHRSAVLSGDRAASESD